MNAEQLQKAKGDFAMTLIATNLAQMTLDGKLATVAVENAFIFFLTNAEVLKELLDNAVPNEAVTEADQKLKDILNGPTPGSVN